MKKVCLLSFIISLFICSCQKEITPGEADQSTAITGTWNFVSMDAQTQSTIIQNDGGVEIKTISNSTYTTSNNKGSITFGNADFSSNAIGYSVSTNVTSYSYQNNSLFDSSSIPFQYTINPSSTTGSYELIGSDSMYFSGGGLMSMQDTSFATSSSGVKYNLNGNMLTITQRVDKNETSPVGGGDYTLNETGVFVIKFQKQ